MEHLTGNLIHVMLLLSMYQKFEFCHKAIDKQKPNKVHQMLHSQTIPNASQTQESRSSIKWMRRQLVYSTIIYSRRRRPECENIDSAVHIYTRIYVLEKIRTGRKEVWCDLTRLQPQPKFIGT